MDFFSPVGVSDSVTRHLRRRFVGLRYLARLDKLNRPTGLPPVCIFPAVMWNSRKTFEPSTTPQPAALSEGSISSARVSASFIMIYFCFKALKSMIFIVFCLKKTLFLFCVKALSIMPSKANNVHNVSNLFLIHPL